MRMWKNWRYPLETVYPGVKGDIRDATKFTLTPSAKNVIDAATDVDCSWPQPGNQGLFFTYAAIDHDKVGDHFPPYYGVWLQRDDDLVLTGDDTSHVRPRVQRFHKAFKAAFKT